MKTRQTICAAALFIFAMMASFAAPAEARSLLAERLHAQALESFRSGRFPEAYGRFIALAEAGHPTAARYALWMCEHGPDLFGKDWDCSQQQAEDWARAAGLVAPVIGPRHYGAATRPRTAAQR